MSLTPPDHQQIELELELIRFYHSVFSDEVHWIPSWELCFLEEVKNAYCKYSIENRLSEIHFDHPGRRCAYIFLNTPCFASTVAFHFRNLLRFNPWLVDRTVSRGTLSVCCLGGGPTPELVAILKVFEAMLKFLCLRPLTVRTTVVDIDPGWQSTVRWMTQNWWKHFDSSVIKLKVNFIQADLTDSMGKEVREAVESSDVVTMVKFLSAVFGTSGREKIPAMLQEITDCMPVNSVLFFMNCSRFNCIEAVRNAIDSAGHMTTIYGPMRGRYVLSRPAMDECFRFYFRYYGNHSPTRENKSDVIAWHKNGLMF